MKKQGFTLIELMVVIVIMGILAAVAVPKLFGMIAKSKASEIGPAAGEYIKLQDAYISETGKYIGSWSAIGYTMSESTPAFSYAKTVQGGVTFTNESATLTSSAQKIWQATANVGLNDCTTGSTWTLYVEKDDSGNGISWGAGVKKGAAGASKTDMDSECSVLTPQFINFRS